MKKLDILLIVLVTIASVAIFYSYIEKLSTQTNNSSLQVYFQSVEIGEAVNLSETTDLEYIIVSSPEKDKLYVTVKDHERNTEVKYTYNVKHNHYIDHHIDVTYNKIAVVEASCEGQDCTKMLMSHDRKVPIVCVLGISIMFKAFEIIV